MKYMPYVSEMQIIPTEIIWLNPNCSTCLLYADSCDMCVIPEEGIEHDRSVQD